MYAGRLPCEEADRAAGGGPEDGDHYVRGQACTLSLAPRGGVPGFFQAQPVLAVTVYIHSIDASSEWLETYALIFLVCWNS